jgi:putative addiction module component (TIGR02574 family)
MSVLQQQQLFDEIDTLPIEIKTQIVDKILNSINPIDKTIDNFWIDEVQKRKKDIENGKVELVSGEDVFNKIAKRLNS